VAQLAFAQKDHDTVYVFKLQSLIFVDQAGLEYQIAQEVFTQLIQ